MIKKMGILKKITDVGVVAVVRADHEEEAERISKACIEGGVTIIEITFTVPGAADVIRSLTSKFASEGVVIGAGSVLDRETARMAILAGAEYIVSPCFDKSTAKLCNRYQIPYMPGCMTITEIKTALEYGADIIKLFPGSHFDSSIIKAIKGPIPQVSIMPTGGVNVQNAHEWIQNGAVAIGVGSELTKPAKEGKYSEVTALAKQYVAIVKEARESRSLNI